MIYSFKVPGSFASLNEFIGANRVRKGNWSKANDMKQRDQAKIIPYITKTIKKPLTTPICINYVFYEKSTRRDLDNVSSYFIKVFQDALVKSGRLPDDGWKYIKSFGVAFDVDKGNPRIEITISEV